MIAQPLTLGTAGHIDHGKTSLIKALTGVDTDRLPQERSRGISIELGYASLELPSGDRLSVVDVPGHERYVRTMVAGATGIDMYLMAIAADDGVMPQTREHAEVLRALGVRHGVVAITKSDIADPSRATSEARELFGDARVVTVSVRSGEGIDELLGALAHTSSTLTSRAQSGGPACLHIDRVFTIRGAGTVVTGTLWSGTLERGQTAALLPGARRARVRELQVHDIAVERAEAGQRVAVNLTGVSVAEVDRGDVLAGSGSDLRESYVLDCQLELGDREPESGGRVQVHHGTRESAARLAWLGGRFWQLRLQRPLIARAGDRFVVRQIAPPDTLGGGRVLDPRARKHGPSRDVLSRLNRLAAGEPGREAAPSEAKVSASTPAPSSPTTSLSRSALKLEQRLLAAGFEPPLDAELDSSDLQALREAGRAVRVTRSLHYHAQTLETVKRIVIERGPTITIAELRDELGTSRKFAQALLEHLDAERVTIRRGDEHHLRAR